jgi:hypothetical protein
MPKPSELILSLHSILPTIIERLDAAAKAEEKAQGAQAMIEATVRETEAASNQIKFVQAKLAEAEAALESREHVVPLEAARRLLDLYRELAAKQAELAALQESRKD